MQQLAEDIYGTAFKGGSVSLMVRIVDGNGEPIHQADIRVIEYSVFLLDYQDADVRTAVEGHDAVTVPVADAIFDTLQTGFPWDTALDALGFNFRHTIDVSQHPAFLHADRNYLVEYRLTPAVGQVILARFRIYAI